MPTSTRQTQTTDGYLVSDEDRSRAVASLRSHYADGSLSLEEYSRRVGAALASQTRGQLQTTFRGLPGGFDWPADDDVPPLAKRLTVKRQAIVLAVLAAAISAAGVVFSNHTRDPRFDRHGIVVGTIDPLRNVPPADVYIVPLDRRAWDDDGTLSLLRLQRELAKRGLKTVLAPPYSIDKTVYDYSRHQINAYTVLAMLHNAYVGRPVGWPATVIGITSVDEFAEGASYRFVFMQSYRQGHAGFAVISTARMHGKDAGADLEKMAARAAGLYFYRLPLSAEWSVMHDPIRSLKDLDRMRDEYGVPSTLLRRRSRETRSIHGPF
jgi:hypothetical protein